MVTNSKKIRRNIFIIVFLTLFSILVNMPQKVPLNLNLGFTKIQHTFYKPELGFKLGNFEYKKNVDLKYGLDLAGGASLLYEIDTSGVKPENVPQALESLKGNIERRVNLFGLSEANVQTSSIADKNRLTIELPGIENVSQAISLIGKTAQLTFKGETEIPPEATASATIYDLFSEDTGLNGSHLTSSMVQPNPNTGQLEVSLEFNSEGAKLFEQATQKYLGKRIAIFLDESLITFPTVQSVIPDGKAVINGSFDSKAAKELSAQLNAGALPLPINLIQQSNIGATLGKDSVDKGIFAAIVGLIIVCLFMIANYGYLGFIACLGLIIYGLITLTLYRLIPVTLTFPGIVGFILSVGMAVDSNILIFERMKEEIRRGKDWNSAMELGFGRAWDSIKDANTCTIITGLILFNPLNWQFLNSSGMVRGFAVTLVLGIIIGIFTGVFVTRNLLRVFARHKNQ